MTGTLLDICSEAAARIGLGRITSIASSTDETAVRLQSQANAAGRALVRRFGWQVIRKEHTFTTVAASEQTDTPIPTDFDRFVNDTAYNRTARRKLSGPKTPQEWQQLSSLTVSISTDAFIIRGGNFLILPAPAASQTVAYEYISKYWVAESSVVDPSLTRFDNDSDYCVLDEEMMILDVMWRYLKSVGLDYEEDMQNSEFMIADRMARDGGKRVINTGYSETRRIEPARTPVIPEGDWTL